MNDVILLGVWIVIGLLTYGFAFAHFQRCYALIAEDQYWNDVLVCFLMGFLYGPIGLISFIIAFIPIEQFETKKSHNPFRYGMKFW